MPVLLLVSNAQKVTPREFGVQIVGFLTPPGFADAGP